MGFGCSKEASHWDGSFEYPQHRFWIRNKENNFPIRTPIWRPAYRMAYHYIIVYLITLAVITNIDLSAKSQDCDFCALRWHYDNIMKTWVASSHLDKSKMCRHDQLKRFYGNCNRLIITSKHPNSQDYKNVKILINLSANQGTFLQVRIQRGHRGSGPSPGKPTSYNHMGFYRE